MAEPPTTPTGIYLLANDVAYDWFAACVAGIRAHEPDLPIRLIPWDDRLDRVMTLARRMDVELFEHPALEELDALGESIWPGGSGNRMFRKLSAFEGPAERFLFLDADIAVLAPLSPFLDALGRSGAGVMYFHADLDQVYRPGPFRDAWTREHASAGFNAGAWGARRGALAVDRLLELGAIAREHAADFVPNVDQPFFNFAVDHDRVPTAAFVDWVTEPVAAWAGMHLRRSGDGYELADSRVDERGKVAFIHWAGYELDPFIPYGAAYRAARGAACSPPAGRRAVAVRSLADWASHPKRAWGTARSVPARARWALARRRAQPVARSASR